LNSVNTHYNSETNLNSTYRVIQFQSMCNSSVITWTVSTTWWFHQTNIWQN